MLQLPSKCCGWSVRFRRSEPSVAIDQISGSPVRSETNAIRVPSGAYAGTQSPASWYVSCVGESPSTATRVDQISSFPERFDVNARTLPSGDQAGPQSSAPSDATGLYVVI